MDTSEKKTILVVDDDREIVRAIALNLESEGYHVLKAYDGIEAPDFQDKTIEELKSIEVTVNETSVIRHTDGLYDYTFYCEMPGEVSEEEIIKHFNGKCKVDITR